MLTRFTKVAVSGMIQAIEDIIPEGSKLAHVYNVLIVVS